MSWREVLMEAVFDGIRIGLGIVIVGLVFIALEKLVS